MKKVRNELKYIVAVFKVKLHMWMVYRLKLAVWIISGIIEPIVWSVLWYAVAQKDSQLAMTGPEVLSYYLMISLVYRLTRSWTFETLRKEILSGKYSKYLVWPRGIVGFRLGADMANKVITVSALLPVWFVWMFVLLENGWLQLEAENIALFGFGLIFASAIRFLLDMILGHIALWFEKIDGIALVYHSVSKLLGGMTVPLILLPDWAYNFARFSPFRYIFSFPVELFQGKISPDQMRLDILVGIGWLILGVAALQFVFKVGLKKYEAVGI